LACEKNILELPFSPSLPADTDVVIFTLADGSTVIRYWGTVKAAFMPLDDLRLQVGGGGANDPADGATAVTLPGTWAGKRIRVQRGGPGAYQRFDAFTRTGGGFTMNDGDVLTTGEWLIIENY
jgi:hypothetical protein